MARNYSTRPVQVAAAFVTLFGMIWLALSACAAEGGTGQSDELHIAGDTALGDLPQGLVNAYEAQSNLGLITYSRLERSQVLSNLKSGAINVALLMHPPDDREVFTTAVGFETLVVVVGADLHVSNLSESDLRAIFAGRKADWADVGGPDLPIQPVVPFASRSERVAFEAFVMQQQPVGASSLVAAQPAQLAVLIRGNPGRVGLIVGSDIPSGLKALTINGEALPATTGPRSAYPLIVTISFASASEPQGSAKAFLDWILSPDGQAIVASYAMPIN